jgi:hypothetical protein
MKDKEENKTILEIGINRQMETAQLKSQLDPCLKGLLPQGLRPLSYPGSYSEMSEGLLEDAIKDYNRGRFRESIKKAQSSISLFKSVLDPSQPSLQNPNLTPNRLSLKRQWLFTRPVRGDYAVYAGITLALLLSVLLVWQTYYPQLSSFGISQSTILLPFFLDMEVRQFL